MDGMIEDAFQPGCFIPYHAGYSFVSNLRRAADEIAKLVALEPARAVMLYETFLAGVRTRLKHCSPGLEAQIRHSSRLGAQAGRFSNTLH
jgi:hypothetical protein